MTMANNLWQDYWFLTREMASFIARQELDMFYELQDQRVQLQALIDEAADYDYLKTQQGRQMIREVQAADLQIATHLRGKMNQLSQQRQVRQAYNASYAAPQRGRTDFSG